MLRIAVCDDVPFYVEKLSESINGWAKQRRMNIQLKKYRNGEEVLLDFEVDGDFTAIFMDIELGGVSGMETAAQIRRKNQWVSVVFVSQHEKYLKQMFELYPSQYIGKPFSRRKVYEALDHVVEDQRVRFESYTFQYNRTTYTVTLKDVLYFESQGRRVKVWMDGGREYVFYGRLNLLEESLSVYNSRFIRIHQSYLVNGRQIERFQPGFVTMRNGSSLPVSRERRYEIGQLYSDILSQNAKNYI